MPNIAVRTASGGKSHATAKAQYAQLVAGFSPVAIENKAELGRALAAVADLMARENRSSAETSLLKLLAVLIEDFEQKRYSMGDAAPVETLKELMRAREMQAKDLWPVFGSKGITSEVLNGKRGISNEMARKLGEVFRVSPAVFISMHPMQSRIDAVNTKKQEVRDGVSLRLAPGYRVVPDLIQPFPTVRVFKNDTEMTGSYAVVKGVGITESAERIVGSIIKWLSDNCPGALKSAQA